MSQVPSRLERKAIVLPSGEIAGSRAGVAFVEMRCHALPLESAVKIFHAPSESAETIKRPLGTSSDAGSLDAARLAEPKVESSAEAETDVENVRVVTRTNIAAAARATARGRIMKLISAMLLYKSGAIIPQNLGSVKAHAFWFDKHFAVWYALDTCGICCSWDLSTRGALPTIVFPKAYAGL